MPHSEHFPAVQVPPAAPHIAPAAVQRASAPAPRQQPPPLQVSPGQQGSPAPPQRLHRPSAPAPEQVRPVEQARSEQHGSPFMPQVRQAPPEQMVPAALQKVPAEP